MSAVPRVTGGFVHLVRCVVLDVDGVLTDGLLYYGAEGEVLKRFHVRDGLGLELLREAGVEVAVVSARASEPLHKRLRDLGVVHAMTGCRDKRQAVQTLAATLSIQLREMAFVGDDLLDLPAMELVGFPVAVADAHPRVKAAARWVTTRGGGRGAVRELADLILDSGREETQAGEPDAARGSQPTEFSVIIPARFGSTRLPGKPLLELAGKPVLSWVCDAALASGARSVCVATDDERIGAIAEQSGVHAMMTAPSHTTGTDRIAEVVQRRGLGAEEIVVNVQGDEPLLPPALIRMVAGALSARPLAGIATLATPIRTVDDLFDPNVVKVVLDAWGYAAYFSRAPIPWARGVFGGKELPLELPAGVPYLRHIGLYAYRVSRLREVTLLPQVPTEQAESLEQLRALASGIPIHVSVVEEPPGHGVDTQADLDRAAAILTAGLTSPSPVVRHQRKP